MRFLLQQYSNLAEFKLILPQSDVEGLPLEEVSSQVGKEVKGLRQLSTAELTRTEVKAAETCELKVTAQTKAAERSSSYTADGCTKESTAEVARALTEGQRNHRKVELRMGLNFSTGAQSIPQARKENILMV